jgi:ABC-2 type transport system ATP-binding protein
LELLLQTCVYEGELSRTNESYEVIKTDSLRKSISRSIIEVGNGMGSNGILLELLDHIQIHRFEEVIPSMNDIFISVVKAKSHE